jgi:probable HAF family extracellular repeat protein
LGAADGYGVAYGINDSGQIVGESDTPANQTHAFLRTGTNMGDLGTLGGSYSSAHAINSFGHAAGESTVSAGAMHAFFYDGTNMTDIGTLGGADSSASGINDSDQIVGYAFTAGGASHAFVYNRANGVMSDLGALNGSESAATAINNHGQIVGYIVTNGASHAFYYDGVRLSDLNNMLPAGSAWTELTAANAINDLGQITGYGTINGQPHAFLLTPTVRLGSPSAVTNGAFQISVSGFTEKTWTIEGSTNLVDWSELQTLTPGSSPGVFRDISATNFQNRFYRAVLSQ